MSFLYAFKKGKFSLEGGTIESSTPPQLRHCSYHNNTELRKFHHHFILLLLILYFSLTNLQSINNSNNLDRLYKPFPRFAFNQASNKKMFCLEKN